MAINDLAKYGYKPDTKCKKILIINSIIFRNAENFYLIFFFFKEQKFLKMKNIESSRIYSFYLSNFQISKLINYWTNKHVSKLPRYKTVLLILCCMYWGCVHLLELSNIHVSCLCANMQNFFSNPKQQKPKERRGQQVVLGWMIATWQ
jgi:hypothetical protein